MALWLIRAGGRGKYEQRFLEESRVYLTWDGLNHNLGGIEKKPALRKLLEQTSPSHTRAKISNHTGQIWAFVRRMQPGDWFVLPSKYKPAIHVAEIAGPYVYNGSAEDPFFHYRMVRWIETDIPRSNFDQDLLYSFGAFLTVCQIKRNDAERRVRRMSENGWTRSAVPAGAPTTGDEEPDDETSAADLEVVARDQIAKLIQARFKGHRMAQLVDAILQAQGYTTYVSPEGPDKGVDLLAASGPLGFGEPWICVQVKSGGSPLDRPTLDQLIGTMQNVHAQHGLLVSWAGFKRSIDKEKASQFFRVRLWDQDDLIDHLLTHYEKLNDDLRADLPLKRVWTMAAGDDEEGA